MPMSSTRPPAAWRRWPIPRWGLALLTLAVIAAAVVGPAPASLAQPRPVLVFAAASLKNALDDIVAQYERETGKKVSVSYGASPALARQIESGAPADVFISAD